MKSRRLRSGMDPMAIEQLFESKICKNGEFC